MPIPTLTLTQARPIQDAKRDGQSLQPYIFQRFRWVGSMEVAWLEDRVAEASKRKTVSELGKYTAKYSAPTTRKRKSAS